MRTDQQCMGIACIEADRRNGEDESAAGVLVAGGDTFDVLVKKAGKSSTHSIVRGRVEDSGEGLYRASYVANFAGTYEVQVTAGGAQHHLHISTKAAQGRCCVC
jgi:hypothetical protein